MVHAKRGPVRAWFGGPGRRGISLIKEQTNRAVAGDRKSVLSLES
jgi:hypothetical protein